MERDAHNGCIMILGAPNDNNGNLCLIAKLRLRQGKKELLLNPSFKILLTGGFGEHFNQTNYPHWQYAKDFLIKELLVSPGSFLPEAIESSNTVEDIEKAKAVLEKYNFRKIILVTSEFHVQRVQYIAARVLNIDQGTIFYSYVPDEELDKDLLNTLCEHEKRAIEHLKLNYHYTPVN